MKKETKETIDAAIELANNEEKYPHIINHVNKHRYLYSFIGALVIFFRIILPHPIHAIKATIQLRRSKGDKI